MAMGGSLLGLYEINLPFKNKLPTKAIGIVGALFMGAFFGLASTPCATPVLVVILAMAAVKGQILYGILLLFIYALGHCTLIFIAGLATGLVSNLAGSGRVQTFSNYLKKISGALIILGGAYIVYLNI